MESAHSIRFLYRHFLSGITEKSLNAFYYACTHAKVDYFRFMNVTAAMALKLVPERLKSQPVFLCIDDTMVAKFGKKVEDVSKLFDHAAHNGSNYLNGHCFVSLMLCVPVWRKQRIVYLAVPLGCSEKGSIQAETGGIHGTAGYAGVICTEKCHHPVRQLVCQKRPGVYHG